MKSMNEFLKGVTVSFLWILLASACLADAENASEIQKEKPAAQQEKSPKNEERSEKTEKITCSVDAIPIQITYERRRDPETILSEVKISETYPHFRTFVMAITSHIALRLAEKKLCINGEDSKKQTLLQFVNWDLTTMLNEPLAPVQSMDKKPTDGCRITSPWIDLSIERTPTPWVRGVVRWNPRQLLADQAVLAGARNVPDGLALPLWSDDFWHIGSDYSSSEIDGEPAAKPVDERIPPDLLWLFRRSWQSTLTPFPGSALATMRKAMDIGAEQHTKLVVALIDHCFDAGGKEHHYNNILDAADLVPLEQYKIDTPIN